MPISACRTTNLYTSSCRMSVVLQDTVSAGSWVPGCSTQLRTVSSCADDSEGVVYSQPTKSFRCLFPSRFSRLRPQTIGPVSGLGPGVRPLHSIVVFLPSVLRCIIPSIKALVWMTSAVEQSQTGLRCNGTGCDSPRIARGILSIMLLLSLPLPLDCYRQ